MRRKLRDVRAVRIHQEDVLVTDFDSEEDELGRVRRPTRLTVGRGIRRQPQLPAPVFVHHVDLGIPISVAPEGDLGAFRGPIRNAIRPRTICEPYSPGSIRQNGVNVADLLALGPLVVSSRVLVEGAIRYAENLTVYDAAYLVLAAARRIPIYTLDTRLAREARKTGVTVLVPGTDPLVT